MHAEYTGTHMVTSLSLSGELKRGLNKIARCSDEGTGDQFSEPLEIGTYAQFAKMQLWKMGLF